MEEMFFCPSCMAKAAPVDGKCPVCGSELNIENAPHQLPVNSILNGRYLVGKVLGAGGFGITYIGYDLRLDGKVAIKEYYPSGAANRSMSLTVFPTNAAQNNPFDLGKSRFLTEAKTLSEFVEDGNIVTLRDYFEENGTAYIVMEYLEGEDLSHYAKEHGILEMDEAFALLEPAMLALDKVHKKGLVHRDISPSNIMVLSDGRVKVLDFGSARLQNASGEQSLTVMLKHGYAPEEQYRPHGEQGPWTDVYAMSATIYKLITGKTPPAATERMFEDTLVPPSKLGAKLTPAQEKALMHGLALRAPDRTQSMAELAASLRTKKKAPAVKAEKPKKEKPPRQPKPESPPKTPEPVKEPKEKETIKKSAKLKKNPIIAAASVLAVLVLCLAVFMPKRGTDTTDTPDAQTATETPAESAPSLNPRIDGSAPNARASADDIDDIMTSEDGKYEIAFVTDGGQLKDRAYNQGTFDGVKLYAAENGLSHKYYQPANGDQATDDDRYDAMKAAVDGGAKVVVCAGFMQGNALAKAAAEFTDVDFIFIDGWAFDGLDNIAGIAFKEEQCGYFAGYAVVKEGYTRLGFTGAGGGFNPACCRYGYGFVEGANAAAAEEGVIVEVNYSWEYGASYSASPELQAMASDWYETGTEIIFVCGGSMLQSVAAAASANDAAVVGFDVDQSFESDTVVTSAMKGLTDAAEWAIAKAYDGTWSDIGGKATALGVNENAVCLPTATWSMTNYTVEEYEELLQKIASGKLTIDADYETNLVRDRSNLILNVSGTVL